MITIHFTQNLLQILSLYVIFKKWTLYGGHNTNDFISLGNNDNQILEKGYYDYIKIQTDNGSQIKAEDVQIKGNYVYKQHSITQSIPSNSFTWDCYFYRWSEYSNEVSFVFSQDCEYVIGLSPDNFAQVPGEKPKRGKFNIDGSYSSNNLFSKSSDNKTSIWGHKGSVITITKINSKRLKYGSLIIDTKHDITNYYVSICSLNPVDNVYKVEINHPKYESRKLDLNNINMYKYDIIKNVIEKQLIYNWKCTRKTCVHWNLMIKDKCILCGAQAPQSISSEIDTCVEEYLEIIGIDECDGYLLKLISEMNAIVAQEPISNDITMPADHKNNDTFWLNEIEHHNDKFQFHHKGKYNPQIHDIDAPIQSRIMIPECAQIYICNLSIWDDFYYKHNLYPIKVKKLNGNQLCKAISLFIFGTEDYHYILRLNALKQLIIHQQYFMKQMEIYNTQDYKKFIFYVSKWKTAHKCLIAALSLVTGHDIEVYKCINGDIDGKIEKSTQVLDHIFTPGTPKIRISMDHGIGYILMVPNYWSKPNFNGNKPNKLDKCFMDHKLSIKLLNYWCKQNSTNKLLTTQIEKYHDISKIYETGNDDPFIIQDENVNTVNTAATPQTQPPQTHCQSIHVSHFVHLAQDKWNLFLKSLINLKNTDDLKCVVQSTSLPHKFTISNSIKEITDAMSEQMRLMQTNIMLNDEMNHDDFEKCMDTIHKLHKLLKFKQKCGVNIITQHNYEQYWQLWKNQYNSTMYDASLAMTNPKYFKVLYCGDTCEICGKSATHYHCGICNQHVSNCNSNRLVTNELAVKLWKHIKSKHYDPYVNQCKRKLTILSSKLDLCENIYTIEDEEIKHFETLKNISMGNIFERLSQQQTSVPKMYFLKQVGKLPLGAIGTHFQPKIPKCQPQQIRLNDWVLYYMVKSPIVCEVFVPTHQRSDYVIDVQNNDLYHDTQHNVIGIGKVVKIFDENNDIKYNIQQYQVNFRQAKTTKSKSIKRKIKKIEKTYNEYSISEYKNSQNEDVIKTLNRIDILNNNKHYKNLIWHWGKDFQNFKDDNIDHKNYIKECLDNNKWEYYAKYKIFDNVIDTIYQRIVDDNGEAQFPKTCGMDPSLDPRPCKWQENTKFTSRSNLLIGVNTLHDVMCEQYHCVTHNKFVSLGTNQPHLQSGHKLKYEYVKQGYCMFTQEALLRLYKLWSVECNNNFSQTRQIFTNNLVTNLSNKLFENIKNNGIPLKQEQICLFTSIVGALSGVMCRTQLIKELIMYKAYPKLVTPYQSTVLPWFQAFTSIIRTDATHKTCKYVTATGQNDNGDSVRCRLDCCYMSATDERGCSVVPAFICSSEGHYGHRKVMSAIIKSKLQALKYFDFDWSSIFPFLIVSDKPEDCVKAYYQVLEHFVAPNNQAEPIKFVFARDIFHEQQQHFRKISGHVWALEKSVYARDFSAVMACLRGQKLPIPVCPEFEDKHLWALSNPDVIKVIINLLRNEQSLDDSSKFIKTIAVIETVISEVGVMAQWYLGKCLYDYEEHEKNEYCPIYYVCVDGVERKFDMPLMPTAIYQQLLLRLPGYKHKLEEMRYWVFNYTSPNQFRWHLKNLCRWYQRTWLAVSGLEEIRNGNKTNAEIVIQDEGLDYDSEDESLENECLPISLPISLPNCNKNDKNNCNKNDNINGNNNDKNNCNKNDNINCNKNDNINCNKNDNNNCNKNDNNNCNKNDKNNGNKNDENIKNNTWFKIDFDPYTNVNRLWLKFNSNYKKYLSDYRGGISQSNQRVFVKIKSKYKMDGICSYEKVREEYVKMLNIRKFFFLYNNTFDGTYGSYGSSPQEVLHSHLLKVPALMKFHTLAIGVKLCNAVKIRQMWHILNKYTYVIGGGRDRKFHHVAVMNCAIFHSKLQSYIAGNHVFHELFEKINSKGCQDLNTEMLMKAGFNFRGSWRAEMKKLLKLAILKIEQDVSIAVPYGSCVRYLADFCGTNPTSVREEMRIYHANKLNELEERFEKQYGAKYVDHIRTNVNIVKSLLNTKSVASIADMMTPGAVYSADHKKFDNMIVNFDKWKQIKKCRKIRLNCRKKNLCIPRVFTTQVYLNSLINAIAAIRKDNVKCVDWDWSKFCLLLNLNFDKQLINRFKFFIYHCIFDGDADFTDWNCSDFWIQAEKSLKSLTVRDITNENIPTNECLIYVQKNFIQEMELSQANLCLPNCDKINVMSEYNNNNISKLEEEIEDIDILNDNNNNNPTPELLPPVSIDGYVSQLLVSDWTGSQKLYGATNDNFVNSKQESEHIFVNFKMIELSDNIKTDPDNHSYWGVLDNIDSQIEKLTQDKNDKFTTKVNEINLNENNLDDNNLNENNLNENNLNQINLNDKFTTDFSLPKTRVNRNHKIKKSTDAKYNSKNIIALEDKQMKNQLSKNLKQNWIDAKIGVCGKWSYELNNCVERVTDLNGQKHSNYGSRIKQDIKDQTKASVVGSYSAKHLFHVIGDAGNCNQYTYDLWCNWEKHLGKNVVRGKYIEAQLVEKELITQADRPELWWSKDEFKKQFCPEQFQSKKPKKSTKSKGVKRKQDPSWKQPKSKSQKLCGE